MKHPNPFTPLVAILSGVAIVGLLMAVLMLATESPKRVPPLVNPISLHDKIADIHTQGYNSWDDDEYWEQLITRDISHRVEVVCAHGVSFFLYNGRLLTMDQSFYTEARDVCRNREIAKSK